MSRDIRGAAAELQVLARKFGRVRMQGRQWLERHPRVQRTLGYSGCLRTDRQSVARGVAAGLFVALTPVFGVQTLVLLVVCMLLRANFPVAFAASWISNPFTIGPLVLAFNALGRAVFGPLAAPLSARAGVADDALLQTQLTILGSLLIAVPVALSGYAAALWLQRRFSHAEPRG